MSDQTLASADPSAVPVGSADNAGETPPKDAAPKPDDWQSALLEQQMDVLAPRDPTLVKKTRVHQGFLPWPSLELRIYECPGDSSKDCLAAGEAAVKESNTVLSTGVTHDESSDQYTDVSEFKVFPGEPDRGGASFIDRTVRVRFCLGAYSKGLADWHKLERLRRNLIVNGLEAHWSCSKGVDRRAQMVAFFHHVSGPEVLPTNDVAWATVRSHYDALHLHVESAWGRLEGAEKANAKPAVFFRLRRPAHVTMVEQHGAWQHTFGQATFRISVEPYPHIILPLNPATLAIKGVGDVETEYLSSEADAFIEEYRSTHPDDYTADILLIDRPKLDWARLVLTSLSAAQWWTDKTSSYGTGRYDFVYHLNNNALRTDEEVQRADARRSRNLHERNTEQTARISDTIEVLQRENASLRRDQGSILTYVSEAVGHVIENQNSIVTGFTTFATRHLELSRVDGDIANLRQSIMAKTQQISTDRFQGLLLNVSANGLSPDALEAMKQETAAQINTSNRELSSLQSQLHDALERKKGIENQPLLVMPAVATAAPKPPSALIQAANISQTDPETRPAKVARTKQNLSRAPAALAPSSSQASSQGGTTDETPESSPDHGVPPTVRSARQSTDSIGSKSQSSPARARPKPNAAAAGPPGTAAKLREKPKTAARASDEAMNID